VALVAPPNGFDLGTLPACRRAGARRLDVAIVCVKQRSVLVEQIAACRPCMLAVRGSLAKSSGVARDLVEDTIREVALPTSLVNITDPTRRCA